MTGQEKYNAVREKWRELEWDNMRDYLEYYNNLDTGPFVKAVEKMLEMYFAQGMDVFKVAISVPGVAKIKMMEFARENKTLFPIIDKKMLIYIT